MRAIKSVLVMAGFLKRSFPELKEEIILIRAMRDSNIPKFIKDDLPLFDALVQDLFPGVVIADEVNQDLQKQILESISFMKYHVVENQILKIHQLFETFQVRFGVMLVGATNSGKKVIYKILQHALTGLKTKVKSINYRSRATRDSKKY
jgi:dynein heavy chain